MTDDLTERVAELETTVEALQRRLDRLEQSDTAGESDGTDHYDEKVLDQLTIGETYQLDELKAACRAAGLRRDDTILRRVKHLTKAHFEKAGHSRWRYTGGGR